MKVLVLIDGREAIPVRAIPFLTNWEVLSPDVVAEALAGGSDFFHIFNGLTAYRIELGRVKAIPSSFWENFIVRDLRALSDRTRHREITHEDGYSQWRQESFTHLPAAAFVWRDEFEPRFWTMYGPEGETIFQATQDGEFELATRHADIELDFDPFFQSADIAKRVMEGFESLERATESTPEGRLKMPGSRDVTFQSRQERMLKMVAEQATDECLNAKSENGEVLKNCENAEEAPAVEHEPASESLRRMTPGIAADGGVIDTDASVRVVKDQSLGGLEHGVVAHVRGYILNVMNETQWKSAKELFAELERRADEPGSPFEKGKGSARGRLFVRELNKPLSHKTLANAMPILRALSN